MGHIIVHGLVHGHHRGDVWPGLPLFWGGEGGGDEDGVVPR